MNSIFAHWISAYLIYGDLFGLFDVRFVHFVQIHFFNLNSATTELSTEKRTKWALI